MRVTRITKVDPSHFSVQTDCYLSDHSYLSDDWMHIVGGELRPAKGPFIRMGRGLRVTLTDEKAQQLAALAVGESIVP
jgi:hypothetical protein